MNSTVNSQTTPSVENAWVDGRLLSICPELFALFVEEVPLSALLSKLLQLLRRARGPSTRAAVLIDDPESHMLKFTAAVGIARDRTEALERFPGDAYTPTCGNAIVYPRNEFVANVREDKKWQPFLHLCTEFQFQAFWSFVLPASSGRFLGTLCLYHADPGLPTDEDAQQIGYFVKAAALLVEHRLKQEAQNSDLREREAAMRASSPTGMSISIVAHELRNPLSAISNAVKALQFGGDELALRKKALAVLDRQAKQMEWLLEDLSDADRAARNLLLLVPGSHNLYEILRFAIETVQGKFEKRNQTLDFGGWPQQEIFVVGDFRRLTQVFVNVLGNASKFSPNGSVVLVRVDCKDLMVTVSVEDAGIGLRSEDSARIFQMFEQVQNTQCEGLGIGLALVKRLVELHGGSVGVRSPGIGQGSVFDINLPVIRSGTSQPP